MKNYLVQQVNIDNPNEVNAFIDSKKEEWDLNITITAVKQEHHLFGCDFEIFLMRMIYKMHIIVLVNSWMVLSLGSDTNEMHPFFATGDHPKRVNPPCYIPPFLSSHKSILHKWVQPLHVIVNPRIEKWLPLYRSSHEWWMELTSSCERKRFCQFATRKKGYGNWCFKKFYSYMFQRGFTYKYHWKLSLKTKWHDIQWKIYCIAISNTFEEEWSWFFGGIFKTMIADSSRWQEVVTWMWYQSSASNYKVDRKSHSPLKSFWLIQWQKST